MGRSPPLFLAALRVTGWANVWHASGVNKRLGQSPEREGRGLMSDLNVRPPGEECRKRQLGCRSPREEGRPEGLSYRARKDRNGSAKGG